MKIREFEPSVQPVATVYYVNLGVGYCDISIAKQHLTIHARGKMEDPRSREWASDRAWGKRGEGGSVTVRGESDLNDILMQWIRGAFEMGRSP